LKDIHCIELAAAHSISRTEGIFIYCRTLFPFFFSLESKFFEPYNFPCVLDRDNRRRIKEIGEKIEEEICKGENEAVYFRIRNLTQNA
jgi:hypothetical protein